MTHQEESALAATSWAEFTRQHDLENRLLTLSEQSLALIAHASFVEPFSAFAFREPTGHPPPEWGGCPVVSRPVVSREPPRAG